MVASQEKHSQRTATTSTDTQPPSCGPSTSSVTPAAAKAGDAGIGR